MDQQGRGTGDRGRGGRVQQELYGLGSPEAAGAGRGSQGSGGRGGRRQRRDRRWPRGANGDDIWRLVASSTRKAAGLLASLVCLPSSSSPLPLLLLLLLLLSAAVMILSSLLLQYLWLVVSRGPYSQLDRATMNYRYDVHVRPEDLPGGGEAPEVSQRDLSAVEAELFRLFAARFPARPVNVAYGDGRRGSLLTPAPALLPADEGGFRVAVRGRVFNVTLELVIST